MTNSALFLAGSFALVVEGTLPNGTGYLLEPLTYVEVTKWLFDGPPSLVILRARRLSRALRSTSVIIHVCVHLAGILLQSGDGPLPALRLDSAGHGHDRADVDVHGHTYVEAAGAAAEAPKDSVGVDALRAIAGGVGVFGRCAAPAMSVSRDRLTRPPDRA